MRKKWNSSHKRKKIKKNLKKTRTRNKTKRKLVSKKTKKKKKSKKRILLRKNKKKKRKRKNKTRKKILGGGRDQQKQNPKRKSSLSKPKRNSAVLLWKKAIKHSKEVVLLKRILDFIKSNGENRTERVEVGEELVKRMTLRVKRMTLRISHRHNRVQDLNNIGYYMNHFFKPFKWNQLTPFAFFIGQNKTQAAPPPSYSYQFVLIDENIDAEFRKVGWQKMEDNGKTYFGNNITSETQWDPPEGWAAGWLCTVRVPEDWIEIKGMSPYMSMHMEYVSDWKKKSIPREQIVINGLKKNMLNQLKKWKFRINSVIAKEWHAPKHDAIEEGNDFWYFENADNYTEDEAERLLTEEDLVAIVQREFIKELPVVKEKQQMRKTEEEGAELLPMNTVEVLPPLFSMKMAGGAGTTMMKKNGKDILRIRAYTGVLKYSLIKFKTSSNFYLCFDIGAGILGNMIPDNEQEPKVKNPSLTAILIKILSIAEDIAKNKGLGQQQQELFFKQLHFVFWYDDASISRFIKYPLGWQQKGIQSYWDAMFERNKIDDELGEKLKDLSNQCDDENPEIIDCNGLDWDEKEEGMIVDYDWVERKINEPYYLLLD